MGGTISGLTVGGLVLSNGTDTLNVAANASTFTMPTGVAYGAAYAVTVKTQPAGHSCAVSNGSGTMGAQNVASVSVACTANPQFAYSPDYNDSLLFQYSVDASTNLLSAAPVSTTATGNTPVLVAATPSGAYVYTVNRNDSTISEFSVDPTTGALTSLGAAVSTVSSPVFIAINSAGTFAFVVGTGSGSVAVYSIGSNGGLVAVSGSPFASGATSSYGLAFNPAGTVLYVPDYGGGAIQAMTINTSTGALTNNGSESHAISQFSINSSTGVLTAIGTSAGNGGSAENSLVIVTP